ncbi:MAG: 3-oxoacyl-ACP synthase, partial [Bacteroidia bacterium]
MSNKAFIQALDWYVPEKKLGNEDIQKAFAGQIPAEDFSRLGIRSRGIADARILASDLAMMAAKKLIASHQITLSAVDALIYCSVHADHITPATSCILHQRLGLPESCATYDLRHGCSGYVYGLSLAKALVEGLGMKNVLLLTSSVLSKYVHPKDKA